MKRGLYACAGASATASAAAWAKRFDEPITNESNVYFGLTPATWPNHVWKVVSFRASRSRAATSFQTPSADSSVCCSTPAARSFARPYGGASIAASPPPLNEDFSPCPQRRIAVICRDLRVAPHPLHSCGKDLAEALRGAAFHGFSTLWGMWTTASQIGPAILGRRGPVVGPVA